MTLDLLSAEWQQERILEAVRGYYESKKRARCTQSYTTKAKERRYSYINKDCSSPQRTFMLERLDKIE